MPERPATNRPRRPASRRARPRPQRARRFPGISARAFQHPADAAALLALKKVPGFDLVLSKLFALVGDRALRLGFLASSVRVSPHQFGFVWEEYERAADALDVSPIPELFVAQTPFVNAGAMGLGKPFVVLNSGTLDLLEPRELRFLLAHELGHVLSGHGLYKTMLRLLVRLSTAALAVPAGAPAVLALTLALLEWDRKSELSADRAGLLALQDLDVALRVQMKLAGGGRTDEMSVAAFLEQAREYEEAGSVVDSVHKLLHLTGQTHPFPVLRLAELKTWASSEEYERILSGDYPLRTEEREATLGDEIRRTAAGYREQLATSRDPLVRWVRDALEGLRSRARGRPAPHGRRPSRRP